jgi:carbohydrate-selective porin OprB
VAFGFIRAWVNIRAVNTQQAMLAASGATNPTLELGENVFEPDDGFQATPWLLLHPNIQYIVDPGGARSSISRMPGRLAWRRRSPSDADGIEL